ncbi:MAG: DUF4232 domain-containing protein [Acidimicrobiales bacterium]
MRAVAVLAVAMAAACSGHQRAAAPTAGTGTSAPATTGPAVVPTTGEPTTALAPAPTSAPPPAAVPERCHTSDLTATAGDKGVALGNVGVVVALVNQGSTRCRLQGYPGVSLVDGVGARMPTDVARGGSYVFPDPAPATVDLVPGGAASFGLGWNHTPTGEYATTTCPASASVAVIPPGETAALVVPLAVDVCPGSPVAVTALLAGAAGPRPG